MEATNSSTNYLVTHTSPDFDSLGYLWLMRRFGGAGDMPAVFVNTGSPDPTILADAWSVGDTGRVFDPAARRFDHHQLPGRASNQTCATMQTYEWLCSQSITPELTAIRPLIELIFCGDTGSPLAGAEMSKKVGIHALLVARLKRGETDDQLDAWGCAILNDLADVAIAGAEAARLLDSYITYRSEDGKVLALENAPREATTAAFEAGALYVFFASEDRGSFARGVQRGRSENDLPAIGPILDLVALNTPHMNLISELYHWFSHPAGFFAGRGTAKAPCATPMSTGLTIALIAQQFDHEFIR